MKATAQGHPFGWVVSALAALAVLTGCGAAGSKAAEPTWVPKPEGPPPADAPQLPGAPSDPSGPERPRPGSPGDVNVVATGLRLPWGLAVLPDGSALVGERTTGRILQVQPRHGVPARQVMRLSGLNTAGDGGLLDLALSPGYRSDRLVFAYVTTSTDNRVVRFQVGGRPTPVLTGIPRGRVDNGGRLAFGPDGMLYVGTGDAGEPRSARDPGSPNGKILRIGPDGEVPGDNPAPGSPVFVLGLRNVEAFDWLDPQTLIIAEHGPSGELGRQGGDRVLVARAGDDLGWPEAWSCDALEGMRPPALAWIEAVPPGGGSVYRGDVIPEWKGSFLFGTLRSRHLHRALVDGNGRLVAHETYFQAGLGRTREVVQAPDGALWVTTSNCDGRGTCPPEKDVIVRIVRQSG